MNEDKKYFWLKLKRDFFKRHDIEIIESMPNGEKYVLFYLKLLTESIDHEGRLRFSDTIPYKDTMLATITRTDIDVVRSAIKIFTELKMMEIFDDDTLYMSQIEDMLGSATVWAEKKRVYRENQKQIENKTSRGQLGGQKEDMSDKSKRLDIEKELEKDIELEKEIKKEEDNTDNLSPKEKKVYPVNKDYYMPEFLKVWKKIESAGIFTLKLYRKNSEETPISEGLTTQEMMLSLLNGTFIEDWHIHVPEKQKQYLQYLQDMSWERIVSICSIPAIKGRTHAPVLKDFLVNLHNPTNPNYSQFLSWTGPQYGSASSNLNSTIPNVTMQNNGTISESVQLSLKTLKSCSKFKVRDEKKLIESLNFLDSWVKQGYSWIEEYNNGKNRHLYNSLPSMMRYFVKIMENWESKSSFDESFVEYGKWGWNLYAKKCRMDEGVEIELGEQSKKSIMADRECRRLQAELTKEKGSD